MIPSFLHTYMQSIKVYLIDLKCTRIWPVLRQTGNQTVEKHASQGICPALQKEATLFVLYWNGKVFSSAGSWIGGFCREETDACRCTQQTCFRRMILYVEQVLAISFGLLYSKNRKKARDGCIQEKETMR